MKFEDLKLVYGYPLQLQVNNNGQPERFSCRLVGCLPGRSILLSVPRVAGKLGRFRSGQKMVARLMVDNGIGMFACVVEAQTSEPYPLLHVSYPDNVSFKGIRGATRVAVRLPAEVVNISGINELPISGALADISISGARMELNDAIGEVGDKLSLSASIDILGIVRQLQVNAVIRSRVERSTQEIDEKLPAVYGIEFTEKDEDHLLLLYTYVFSQIAKDDHTS